MWESALSISKGYGPAPFESEFELHGRSVVEQVVRPRLRCGDSFPVGRCAGEAVALFGFGAATRIDLASGATDMHTYLSENRYSRIAPYVSAMIRPDMRPMQEIHR
jgi:hypothetical protein